MKRGLFGALCLVVVAAPSFAQNAFLREMSRTGLVQEDVDIMVDAGRALYATGTASVGDDTIWLNPNTNAHGLVEVLAVEGDCVRLAYKFQTRRQPTSRTMTTRRCLVDGRWVLSG